MYISFCGVSATYETTAIFRVWDQNLIVIEAGTLDAYQTPTAVQASWHAPSTSHLSVSALASQLVRALKSLAYSQRACS